MVLTVTSSRARSSMSKVRSNTGFLLPPDEYRATTLRAQWAGEYLQRRGIRIEDDSVKYS
jgi:hypothetical protein